MQFRTLSVGLAAVTLAGGIGCSRSIYPVSGIVLLDGEPLEGVTVVFEPVESGHPAVASTKEDGSFSVSTAEGAGAAPGEYLVTLTKITGREPDTMPPWIRRDGKPPTEAEKSAWARQKAEEKAKETQWIPEPYLKTSTTPLRFTVPVDGKLLFELSSDEETASAE